MSVKEKKQGAVQVPPEPKQPDIPQDKPRPLEISGIIFKDCGEGSPELQTDVTP